MVFFLYGNGLYRGTEAKRRNALGRRLLDDHALGYSLAELFSTVIAYRHARKEDSLLRLRSMRLRAQFFNFRRVFLRPVPCTFSVSSAGRRLLGRSSAN